MSRAVVGAVEELAIVTVESLVAEAGAVSANSVVGASTRAFLQRAVESSVASITKTSEVGSANTIVAAVVGALLLGAVRSSKSGVASACSIITPSMSEAIVGATQQGAIRASPAREAVAHTIVAVAALVAIRLARFQ